MARVSLAWTMIAATTVAACWVGNPAFAAGAGTMATPADRTGARAHRPSASRTYRHRQSGFHAHGAHGMARSLGFSAGH